MRHLPKFILLSAILILPLLLAPARLAMGQPFEAAKLTPQSLTGKEDGEEPSSETEITLLDLPTAASFSDAPAAPALAPLTIRQEESEPNNSLVQANPLSGSSVKVLGNIFPNADADFYSFSAAAGDRVYAAVVTTFSANGSSDSFLSLQDAGGVNLEIDNDDGSLGSLSSSIAGATIPSTGTYYLKVNHFSTTNSLRPYSLYLHLQSGAPVAEAEPNNATAAATPLPASGWVSGTITAADVDFYSLSLNAGDTIFASLDLDPERDNVTWNGRLGFGILASTILTVNDGNMVSPNSEFFTHQVKASGTYYLYVDEASAVAGSTYHLSVSVASHLNQSLTCNTYTNNTLTPLADLGTTTSTIVVPDSTQIADLDVSVDISHTFMTDLDVWLTSPTGNIVGLFTDVGQVAINPQGRMDATLDDEAAIPISTFTLINGVIVQPELNYRLSWLDGTNSQGSWQLSLADDVSNDTGVLNSWSITVCEAPPQPACPLGTYESVLFSTDFESSDGGFTHTGTQDEWEYGTPAFSPLVSCASGVNCWKTDLDNTYNASSSQDLLSPVIDLTDQRILGPIWLTWKQNYQLESASFDHASVEIFYADDGLLPLHLWDWLDATMNTAVGNPVVTLQESTGWATFIRDISAFDGGQVKVRFHLDSDSSVQLPGLAVDDFMVTACTATRIFLPLTVR